MSLRLMMKLIITRRRNGERDKIVFTCFSKIENDSGRCTLMGMLFHMAGCGSRKSFIMHQTKNES